MKFSVRVMPNAQNAFVGVDGERALVVRVDAPAREGKANERLVEILARHFGVAKSAVTIRSGAGARRKIVEIAGVGRSA